MHKVFLDTNILVYAIDRHDLKKQRLSRQALGTLNEDYSGVISTQVVQEFYVTAVNKLGLKPLEAKHIISNFENLEIVQVEMEHIKEAIDCSILNQVSFWDALIIVCAQHAKCETLWSEDLSHSQVFKTVKVENIFK